MKQSLMMLVACTVALAACTTTDMTMNKVENPLLAGWTGPFGGVPPFEKVRVADMPPALEAAMAETLVEIGRIADNPAPPTFENTIAGMERAGRTLDRVETIYGIWSTSMNTEEFEPVETEMEPKLAAFRDKITQNENLFKRIEAVYNSPDKAKLTPEQQRLTWVVWNSFVRSGARLGSAEKARLSEINQKLAAAFTKFSQNVLADEKNKSVEVGYEAPGATNRDGKWVVLNTRSSIEPFLSYSDRRDLREKVWRMFVSRGEETNAAPITEILQLRAERAKLLGYATHAHWRVENTMAKTPERAMELMLGVWPAAVARVREEVADMRAIAGHDIEPWDYRYYAEKVRKAKYDLDENEIKPYLQLDKMREGMFWVAGQLFGFRFTPVTNVPMYHPDVTVYQVTDKDSGALVGLWYFDPYARPGKRSGAWMNSYRSQERFDGDVKTIVSNNSNFVKPKLGQPVLISWDDATTLFHEFGHALHGLSSNVTYPRLAGTAVVRDYVEFPSQLLEHWLSTPEVLQKFAVHHQTGQPIPQSLVDRIKRADTFNQGFATTEYLSSALVDMKLHMGPPPADAWEFERRTLAEMGMPREIVMRHRMPQFMHIFSSDSYSAGYYSYLWSDVLTADAAEAFTEASGFYDPAIAARLRRHVFTVGNTVDPADGYRQFRGRDPRVEALMRKRGFTN